jgi:uncharacterized protein YbjT (DUF2867 family)
MSAESTESTESAESTESITSRLVLVVGAAGRCGAAAIDALVRRGHRVRALADALTHSPSEQVELVSGDVADVESLVRAARGADALLATTASDAASEVDQGIALVRAAAAARVGHMVYCSAAGADRATGVPRLERKVEVERRIAASGVPYTIIAPVCFMEDLVAPRAAVDLRAGRLAMALPAGRSMQHIAVADVGGFAASIIEHGSAMFGRRFDIAGDELTGEQAAEILSEAAGHRIRYRALAPAVLRAHSEELAAMFEWLDRVGHAADIEGLRDDFPEVSWRDFEGWARGQDWRRIASPGDGPGSPHGNRTDQNVRGS